MNAKFMWAVGLFEGEGSMSNYAGRRRALRLQLHITDEDVLRRFAEAVDVGSISGPYLHAGNRKPYWCWHVGYEGAETLLERMLPHLGERRTAQAVTKLAIAKAGHSRLLEEVTAPRPCLGCGEVFRPRYAPGRRQTYCTTNCRDNFGQRRRRATSLQ
jgi:hypothetical protein